MRSLSRQPLFWTLVALPFVGAGVLAVLGFSQQAENRETLRRAALTARSLEAVQTARPSPTEASVRALEGEVRRLHALRGDIRRALASERGLEPAPDYRGPEEVFFELADFTERMAAKCADGRIRVPEDARFGFRDIVERGRLRFDSGDDGARAAAMTALNRQRQVLEHTLTRLVQAEPQSILLVRRESVELEPAAQRLREPELFRIDPLASARVPGAVDTLAFEVTFEGHTAALRDFLAALASFEFPLAVRGVSVAPAASDADRTERGTDAGTAARGRAPTPFEIFGTAAPEAEPTESAPSAVPLVRDNLSRFVVTFEYFEISHGHETNGEDRR
ncbi:MAG: Amuc_1100 family pilus-like protein [Opitutales bacterium]|nr:Amuc_1100 family pilus-like protein [Opitutales bacterium]